LNSNIEKRAKVLSIATSWWWKTFVWSLSTH